MSRSRKATSTVSVWGPTVQVTCARTVAGSGSRPATQADSHGSAFARGRVVTPDQAAGSGGAPANSSISRWVTSSPGRGVVTMSGSGG